MEDSITEKIQKGVLLLLLVLSGISLGLAFGSKEVKASTQSPCYNVERYLERLIQVEEDRNRELRSFNNSIKALINKER